MKSSPVYYLCKEMIFFEEIDTRFSCITRIFSYDSNGICGDLFTALFTGW